MSAKMIGFLVFAVAGFSLLAGLGIWQIQRLEWKTGVLDRIETRIVADPLPLPPAPTESADEYLPVRLSGRLGDVVIRVLVTTSEYGASYRIIVPFATGQERSVLVDLGAVPAAEDTAIPTGQEIDVVGNLLWPDEVDRFTPAPDLAANIWFARDLPAIAQTLGTEALLVVARERAVADVLPLPITTEAIPNNHLQYVITWFSLAAIWAGMTVVLLRRMAGRQR